MKKIIALLRLACAARRLRQPSHADETRQAAAEPTAMLATMQPPQSLPTEAYQAI